MPDNLDPQALGERLLRERQWYPTMHHTADLVLEAMQHDLPLYPDNYLLSAETQDEYLDELIERSAQGEPFASHVLQEIWEGVHYPKDDPRDVRREDSRPIRVVTPEQERERLELNVANTTGALLRRRLEEVEREAHFLQEVAVGHRKHLTFESWQRETIDGANSDPWDDDARCNDN